MKIKVTTKEIRTIERTYYVDGVNTLEAAAKCAERCYNNQYQPNTWLWQEVPHTPQLKIEEYEIVEP